MSKVFFGNSKVMFFKQLSLQDASLCNQGQIPGLQLKPVMSSDFVFIQDPETGFYRFIKFRMSLDPDYRNAYYVSYENVIKELRDTYGRALNPLNKVYNASFYTSGFILEQLQK
ncbi:clamp loader small subunit [Escherichia phage vB_EcoM_ESCO10]|nr:clamp loader small subunit [Escherichia phage vB_EcoM_ESCO10]